MSATIMSIHELLSLPLRIPGYQRPYRWTVKNVATLLSDIDAAIAEVSRYPSYRYRIGTVILHNNCETGSLDIVDGQQRVLSLLLLMLALDERATFPLLEEGAFSNRETQANIRANYDFIHEWVAYQPNAWREDAFSASSDTLEAVVIVVDRVEEAFQLFDSQNTRGRSLDPHDLLKAYHLRAMREDVYEMRHVVTRWEEFSSGDMRGLFSSFLYPILNWKRREKTTPFTERQIDSFKGVPEWCGYTYAIRARRAAPSFQIGSSFIEGEDFFLMAEHYLQMTVDIKNELRTNISFSSLCAWFDRKNPSAGLCHAQNLFLCVLLTYYDRFHNFDERVVRKLFTWAYMIRVDMTSLGFDSINKYAIGEDNGRFTNKIAMFSLIARARRHSEIANLRIDTSHIPENSSEERRQLAEMLVLWHEGGYR